MTGCANRACVVPGITVVGVLAGTRDQRSPERRDEPVDAAPGGEQPQAQVGDDEVVAGAARVQLRAEVAEPHR